MWRAASRRAAAAASRRAALSPPPGSLPPPPPGAGSPGSSAPARFLPIARRHPPLGAFLHATASRRFALPAAGLAAGAGARLALGLAAKTAKLRAARSLYRGAVPAGARRRARDVILGRDAAAAARRVAAALAASAAAGYALTERVPSTNRARLMLFSADDEVALGRAALRAEFEARRERDFLDAAHPKTRRAVAVLWTLVSRLDPSIVTQPSTTTRPSTSTTTSSSTSSSAAAARNDNLMFREGAAWRVHVLDSSAVNAYVVPPGHVFLTSGLMDLLDGDDAALAFVVAHEMGHQLARHGAEKATVALLASVGGAFAWGLGALVGEAYLGGIFAAFAAAGAEAAMEAAVTLPHSREMEREADLIGARVAVGACFDPGGATRAFEALIRREEEDRRRTAGDEGGSAAAKERGGPPDAAAETVLPRYFSTHPLTEDRRAAAAAFASEHAPDAARCEALTRELRARLRRLPTSFFSSAAAAAASSASRGLPPNAFATANRATVSAPTRAWRRRFAREEMRAVADSPRGVQTAAVTLGPRTLGAEHEGVRSGPIGRFDERRLASLASGGGHERSRAPSEVSASEVSVSSEVSSLSRGWRGPVRRAREAEAAAAAGPGRAPGRDEGGVERGGRAGAKGGFRFRGGDEEGAWDRRALGAVVRAGWEGARAGGSSSRERRRGA